jgi:hypothetical protein
MDIAISTAPNGQDYPSVAFDGSNHLVVWTDWRDGNGNIYAARVNQSGVVIDPTGLLITNAIHDQIKPQVAFNGICYLVVWQDFRNNQWDIYGARIDQAGTVLDTAGIAVSAATNEQLSPSVSVCDENFVVIWSDLCNGQSLDIYGAEINTSGTILDSFAVSTQLGGQIEPATVYGTENQLLMTYSGWTDSINGHPTNTMRIWGKFYPFTGIREQTFTQRQPVFLRIFPNPAAHNVNVEFSSPGAQDVQMSVYDIAGRVVNHFDIPADQSLRFTWDGRDNTGDLLPTGVYFIQLQAENYCETRKIILLK